MRYILSGIRSGLKAAQINLLAQETFKGVDMQDYYIHRTGHRLGIIAKGAEPPDLSEVNEEEIKPNMVLAIEPGIYTPDLGIRLEDNIIVLGAGIKNLTQCSYDIAELDY